LAHVAALVTSVFVLAYFACLHPVCTMIGHCALALSFAAGAMAARVVTRSGEPEREATIEGVPVLNNRADIDDFIVTFEEGCTEDSIAKFCDGQCPLFGHPDTGGVAWASVRGRVALGNLLKRRGDVKVQSVEPDEEDKAPDDELEGVVDDEVGIQNTPWGIRRVNAHQPPSAGRGAHIYVQDTGIRVSHRDFGGRASTSLDMTNGPLRECRGNPRCAGDVQGHGTHCAGTAGGRVYGVARSALIYSVKSLGDQGPGQASWQFASVDWVTRSGRRPTVLSMSLGGRGTSSTYASLFSAASRAGVVVVVASGNDNQNACGFQPAFSPAVITVGSTDSRNRRSGFSNWGNCVNIMAPGSGVVSAGVRSDTQANTMSGTSMACPHVSGGAALILGRNPRQSVAAVRSQLVGPSFAEVGTINDLRGSADRFLWVGRRRVPSRR